MVKSTAGTLFEEVHDPGTGRRVSATLSRLGDDLVVAVGGGERPHVGSVVVAQPCGSRCRPHEHSASCSVITIPPHKEEPVARTVATRLAEALGCVVVVSAGIHEDSLDQEGIRVYLELVDRLAEVVVARLTDQGR